LKLLLTAPDRGATQASDVSDAGNPALALLKSQEARNLTTGFFIQGCQQLIDGRVLVYDGTIWLRATSWTRAAIHRTRWMIGHTACLPFVNI
jgi:hypothetical protein